MEAEEGPELGFPTFILEVDVSPLYFMKPSFLLRQARCSLRTTLGSDCLEELAQFLGSKWV